MSIRVTMFFGLAGAGKPFGWSETHWYIAGSTKESARTPATELIGRRLDLCGINANAYAVRISKDGLRGDSLLLTPPEISADAKNSPAGQAGERSDQPNSCLLFRLLTAEGAGGEQRQKALYLAGIPDAVVRTDPVGPATHSVAGWDRALKRYIELLKNGQWGFLARSLTVTKKTVLDYIQETGGTGKLGAVVAPADDIAGPGTVVQIRNATRKNPGLAGANGIWRVASELNPGGGANVTYFLRSSETVAATNIDEPGTIELVQYSYIAYDSIQSRGQTTRKRGVGGFRPHGRSSRRRA